MFGGAGRCPELSEISELWGRAVIDRVRSQTRVGPWQVGLTGQCPETESAGKVRSSGVDCLHWQAGQGCENGLSGPFFFVVFCWLASVQRIRELIDKTVSGLGYETVDVEFAAAGLVRVYIDHELTDEQLAAGNSPSPSDTEAMSIQVRDCEKVSHQLTHVFEVEQVDYSRLEVSSPGTDRPLRTEQHYRRFAGEQITLKLREPFEGQRNFQGVLTVEDDGQFGLEMTNKSGSGSGARRSRGTAGKAGNAVPDEQIIGRKLVFSIEEVERARLVPTYDFRRHG